MVSTFPIVFLVILAFLFANERGFMMSNSELKCFAVFRVVQSKAETPEITILAAEYISYIDWTYFY